MLFAWIPRIICCLYGDPILQLPHFSANPNQIAAISGFPPNSYATRHNQMVDASSQLPCAHVQTCFIVKSVCHQFHSVKFPNFGVKLASNVFLHKFSNHFGLLRNCSLPKHLNCMFAYAHCECI